MALRNNGENFELLGLLAAQVYVATKMGSYASIEVAAYWRLFRELFTKGQPLRQASLDRIDRAWYEARDFYAGCGRGVLVLQKRSSERSTKRRSFGSDQYENRWS